MDLNTRLIDVTVDELLMLINQILDEKVAIIKATAPIIINGLHPETGLPEGPEEWVDKHRAMQILGCQETTLGKYRQAPKFNNKTWENINGGRNLPCTRVGKEYRYPVQALLAIMKDKNHFIQQEIRQMKIGGSRR